MFRLSSAPGPAAPPSARVGAAAIALALGLLLIGCSSSASTRTDAAAGTPATTAAPVTVPDTIPEGTVLRVGDQLDYLQIVLGLAGEDTDVPYEVEYAAFIGGPPMLQAFQGGSLDAGFVGSTPLIFAQAGNQDLVAIAGWARPNGGYGLLNAPGVEDIGGWADVAGRRVAYQEGTAGEAAVLQALDAVGLSADDITPVLVPQTQVTATLQGGGADVGISIEPLTSVYLANNPGTAEIAVADEITDRSSFLIATSAALADPAKEAALGDFIARLVRSFAYLRDHPDEVAGAIYVDQFGLSPERAAEILAAEGVASFLTLPDDISDQQQRLADLFLAAGKIPAEVDVTSQFDTRYNDLVLEVQSP